MRKEFVIGVGTVLAAVLVSAWMMCPRSISTFDTAVSSSASSAAAVNTQPAQAHSISVRMIETGTHAASVPKRTNYAAYSEEGLSKLWKLAHGDTSSMPKIDFAKEYVIGVFAGEKPTGGYAIQISSITDNGQTRTVAVTLSKPDTNCMVTKSLSSPFQIVAVPLSGSSLTHKDQNVVLMCN